MIGKSELLTELTQSNRGIGCNAEEHSAFLSKIAQLEERNPTPSPATATALLDGDWELLYTTSSGLLSINNVPGLRLGTIYQCIRIEAGRIYNIAEIEGLPFCEGLVSVSARVEGDTAAENVPQENRRLNVYFERSILGLQRWINYQTPAQFIPLVQSGKRFPAIDTSIKGRKGWVDLTYLDEELRINRGNEGSIFVLTRA